MRAEEEGHEIEGKMPLSDNDSAILRVFRWGRRKTELNDYEGLRQFITR